MPCRADSLGTGLGPMTDDDYRRMESQSSGRIVEKTIKIDESKYLEMEEDLCIIRDLLFKIIDNRDLPQNIEDILSNQLDKHKEHRKEDFISIKQNIDELIESITMALKFRDRHIKMRYQNAEEYNQTNKGKIDRLEKLKKDKEVIDNLSFDDFWKDRYFFEEYKNEKQNI